MDQKEFEFLPISKWPNKDLLLDEINNTSPDCDVNPNIFNLAALLPDNDRTQVWEAACLHNMESTVNQQLNLGEVLPASHIPKHTIKHRKQTGPYCSLESIHRALMAIGITITPEKVIEKGEELGFSDGAPLLLVQSIIEHLKLSDEVDIQMLPEMNYNLFKIVFSYKLQSFSAHDRKDAPIDSTVEKDEELKAMAQEWIRLLQNENALVMQVNNAAAFWCIPKAFRAAGEYTHAIAVVGYDTDDKGRLAFLVYDPAFDKAPIRIGPKHLASNVSTFYLKLRRINDRTQK